ncbi:MAG: glycosyltransferase family 4 protein [Solirubrobacteraceae bacterium]
MPRRPDHVGINALFFQPDRSSGTETYLRGLVPALAREFPSTRFSVVTTRLGADALVHDGWTEFCSILRMPCDEGERVARLRAEQLSYPVLGARRGWDLLHSLANLAPVRAPTPTVVTVHDVNFFHHRTFGLATTLAMRAIVRRAARRADAIVTVSSASRDDIAATLGVPAERIVVVHNGAGRPPGVAPAPADEVRRRLGIEPGARVVLCVAAIRPHKNQALLVRALPELPPHVVLVLAGHPEPYAAELEALAATLCVADRVRIPGYVDDGEMEALWEMAACAAFPTLAEGFGLPVVEALARGVPVASSDIAVLREVGGELPRYFDPADPASAARAIAAALEAPRGDPAALEWAAQFSWEAAAHGTFEAYERALA